MQDTFKGLSDYFHFDKIQGTFLQVFETLLTIFAGVLLGALIASSEPTPMLLYGTIITLFISAAFATGRILKSLHFPSTAIDYLKAQNAVRDLTKELDRKKTIDEYIEMAIQSLNLNTCPLTNEDYKNLCDNPVEDGLRTVLHPIIQFPQYILDCSKSKFTVAVHLAFYPEKVPIPGLNNRFQINNRAKTIVFRDDYQIGPDLGNDILTDLEAEGLKYQIHSTGRDSYNHVCLKEAVLKTENMNLKLIAAPIPAVCEDGRIGVLFIFSDECVCKPKDLENILLIFGRIVANWISKYEECIRHRGLVENPQIIAAQ